MCRSVNMLNTRFKRCAFMPLGAGHRDVTVGGCAVICFTVLLALVTLATFCRCYQSTMLAIWCEHAMETGQVGSRPGYQGCQAHHKIQWLEDDVGSAISIRRLQLVADVAAAADIEARNAPLEVADPD